MTADDTLQTSVEYGVGIRDLLESYPPAHQGDLATETARLVIQVCRQSATTMRAAKLVIDMVGRALTAADTDLLTQLTAEAYEGQDLKEGVAAFIQRREPPFTTWEAP